MSYEGTSVSYLPEKGLQQPPPARKGSWVRIVVYLVLVAALGLIVWKIYTNQKLNAANSANQAAALMGRPVPVQVTAVEQRPMPVYLTALGTVTPYMTVTVKARVNGELQPVKFAEGQQVRKGETILVIDPRPYHAALDQAEGTLAHDQALLKNAQAEYARYKALFDAGVVSKESMQSYEAAQGQYQGAIESDKAVIENAQLQLNWCTIQSPIDGKIGLRLVDPGNLVAAGTTNLVVINQMEPIAVNFTLPEDQLPPVLGKLRAATRLAVEAYDQGDTVKVATGYLLTADNQIDTTTGTGKLKAVFDNKDQSLYPNQFVNIHLVMEKRPDALVVPSAAIQSGTQGTYVWVIDNDAVKKTSTARIQNVKIALAEGQLTILDSGLAAGQQVVVDGADRLRAGQAVTISAARQRGGSQAAGQSAPGQGTGPNAGQNAGRGAGGGRVKSDQSVREKQ